MQSERPWYRRTYRWGQTNITEIDPTRYDIDWWRTHWRRTRVQGVILNAGGIVAYYPSTNPLQHRALYLGERDLYGELVAAARQEGLAVLARMDCSRAAEDLYRAHPDWFAVDREGQPYRAGDLYVSCIFSPYYDEYIPEVIAEIIERSHPDGFADNSWSGMGRESICYCDHCRRAFGAAAGHELPAQADWDSPVYRQWIVWNYQRRLEVWDRFNAVARSRGGEHCLYLGMQSGDMLKQCERFRDTRAIGERSQIIMLDHQHRPPSTGLQGNAAVGRWLHELVGWDATIPEAMPMYQGGGRTFRISAKPPAEARLWMEEGIAGGLSPWWHHIGAYHEDRRQYRTAEPIMRWHEAHQEYLVDRTPVAAVGVVWSERNIDFYGRDDASERVLFPYWGVIQALVRARIPYLPVHAEHIARHADDLDALVLPNVGALSDGQLEAIRRFVAGGGGLVATGESSLCDEWGDARADLGLADLLGAHVQGARAGAIATASTDWENHQGHTYLRIHPELRAQVDGPQVGSEPEGTGCRHAVLAGFEETDILPFGGHLTRVRPSGDAAALLTYIPAFPIYPPETAWMRETDTTLPGLVVREAPRHGRVAYLPADIDRCFGRDNLPDHGDLLANLIRWAVGRELPLEVQGAGLFDCQLYRQGQRLILHIVNLTNPGAWRGPVHELVPVGPLSVRLRLPDGVAGADARCLVSGQRPGVTKDGYWAQVEIASVLDHEVLVLE